MPPGALPRLGRVAVAAAAILALGAPLPAYLIRRVGTGTEIRWKLDAAAPNVVDGKVTYYVDENSAQDVTGPEFAAAIRSAVRSWEDASVSSIAFREDPGRASGQKNATDKVNRFGFTSGVLPFNAYASAFTFIQNGRIVDVDVVFNPEMTWAVATPGLPDRADVEAVSAHEWGHGIGLDHIPMVRSTMYFSAALGQLSLRSLETDDQGGAAHLYPADDLEESRGRIRGRVDVAGTEDDRGVQVCAIDFVTGIPAASAVSDPTGAYEIAALPPGVYRLVATSLGATKVTGGVFSPFWESSVTNYLPAVRGKNGAADGTAEAMVLAAGQVLEGKDLVVANVSLPGEPNETTGAARPLPLGHSFAGRIEDDNDHDVFSFAGVQGHTVSAYVHAGQIGSDLDPRLYLRAPNGTVLAFNDDIASADYDVSGSDADSRIVDFVLPATGTYFVEVEPASSVDPFVPEDYSYVLSLFEGGTGAASPFTSELTASPAVVPADGVSTCQLTFRPRTLDATTIGTGKAVTFELVADGDPDGVAALTSDHGDGTYGFTIVAPASPGSDVVRAKVGGVEIATVTVSWSGPADFAASGFSVSPRRLRVAASADAVVALVPRDANGLPLGAGRAVVFSLGGSPSAEVGPATDQGDGSYTAPLVAGDVEENLAVAASVDGNDLAGTWFAGVGFPLVPVMVDQAADLAAALAADPLPPAKAIPKMTRARAILVAGAVLAPPSAVAATRKAILQCEAATKKGIDLSPLATEAAEAIRQAAREAIDEATPFADTGKELSLIDKAEAAFLLGDSLLDQGLFGKAAAKHRSAYLQALKVQ